MALEFHFLQWRRKIAQSWHCCFIDLFCGELDQWSKHQRLRSRWTGVSSITPTLPCTLPVLQPPGKGYACAVALIITPRCVRRG